MYIKYLNCLPTYDAWRAYDVIDWSGSIRYITELVVSHISGSQHYFGWLAWLWARSGPVTFHGASKVVI